MAKFCGNCGTQLENSVKVCGNCGTPAIDAAGGKQTKKTVKTVAVIAVVLTLAIIALSIVSGFVGHKGAVRKIMNAYMDYNLSALESASSDFYYFMDDDSFASSVFDMKISNDFDHFENQLGHKYKLSYEVLDSYIAPKHKYERILESLSYSDFDAESISKLRIVEISVTAKAGKEESTLRLELTLTKENGSWKLLYLQ